MKADFIYIVSLRIATYLAGASVFAKSNLNSFIDSFIALLSLMNALITAVGVKRKKANL
ncbi:MAG: hypothetical protein PHW73_11450 [Atribacterota bacterium]|nr:hypothetical protein [Atribacterota bacterium]